MPTTTQNDELSAFSRQPPAVIQLENLKAESSFLKTDKLLWLDLLRGITAFAVFIGHVRTLYFVDYSNIQPNKIAQIFYFLTGFGHQAVIIFFVLSGFFIAKTMDNAIIRNKWRFKDYLINRIVRLETVLIPALILGFFWDSVGMKLLFYLESYSGKIPSLPFFSPIGKLTFETFLGNVFFVQNILTYSFGSNAPLWSLANEFWYYILFPLFYFGFNKKYANSKRVLFIILAIGILFFVGKTISLYFIVWLMGAGAYYINQKLDKSSSTSFPYFNLALLVTSIVFLVIISLARMTILPVFINDFSLAFVSGILVLLLSMCSMKLNILKKTAIYLSNISYTLYLTHVPAAMLVCGLISNDRHDWNFESFVSFFVLTLVLLIYSTVCWYFFERNTPTVKKWINHFS